MRLYVEERKISMGGQADDINTDKNDEIIKIAEMVAILSKYSKEKQDAVKYYLKGWLDAEQNNIDLTDEFFKDINVSTAGHI